MMTCARAFLGRFVIDRSGQDLIEYALVAALVGLGAVASTKSLSTKVGAAFMTIGTSLTSNVEGHEFTGQRSKLRRGRP